MAQKLELKIVNAKEWATIVKSSPRYEYVDDDTMGFADPKAGKAYVRQTYWPDLNRYLLQHEFEHLLEEQGTDEDVHGVRHKRGFLRNAAAILAAPFTLGSSLLVGSPQQHPVIGSPGGGLNQVANAAYNIVPAIVGGTIGGGVGGVPGAAAGAALGSGLGSFATGTPNAGRNAAISAGLAGIGQGLTGGFTGKSFFPASPSTVSPSIASLLSQQAPQSTPVSRLSGGTSGTPLGGQGPVSLGLSGYNPSAAAGITRGAGFDGGGVGGTQFRGGDGDGGFGKWLSNLFGQPANQTTGTPATGLSRFGLGANVLGPYALGAGVSALGAFGRQGKQPAIPEFSQAPSVQNLVQQSNAAYTPLVNRLGNLSLTPLPEELASPIRRNFALQRRQYASQFKMFRPGADIATDTEYKRGVDDINQRELETLARTQFEFQGNERQNIESQARVIADQLGGPEVVAGLDLTTLAARLGVSVQQANQFREVLGNIGGNIMGIGAMNAFRTP